MVQVAMQDTDIARFGQQSPGRLSAKAKDAAMLRGRWLQFTESVLQRDQLRERPGSGGVQPGCRRAQNAAGIIITALASQVSQRGQANSTLQQDGGIIAC